MSDDDEIEIHLHVTYASHLDMDEAFCARMRRAIEAGLENAPIGVVTTPGAKNPKSVKSNSVAQLALRISTTKTVSHPDGLAVFEAGYIGK